MSAPASDEPTAPEADASRAALHARLTDLSLVDEHRLRRRLDALRRTRDPVAAARGLQALTRRIDEAEARIALRRAAVPAVAVPHELPIAARREDLLAAIRDHQVVVVAGETGSGKSTQLPKLCLDLGRGVRGTIAHTQPRRLAARTIAQRIADELGVELGGAVGYAVRFDEATSDATLVRLLTDGLLLAEVRSDRLLRRYDTVILDEAHERSLTIDFLLGYLAQLLPRRPDLKVVVTSATIDPGRFSDHFGGAPIIEVSGRSYPVEVRYRPVVDPCADEADGDERDQVDAVADAVLELLTEDAGDVLVFLSGEREIRDTAEALEGRLGDGVEVLPLYARLSHQEQQRVFRPTGKPRVVLATNVAETSLTVPGIRSVVDPGTARVSRYSARHKVQRLPIEPISRASADQRKGRCGRVAPGVCIRLYPEEDFEARPRFTDPEILRTNLASVILQMAALDLGDVEDFPFLDPPDRRQIRDGVALLHELGALQPGAEDPKDRLTPLGRRLARLPVDPRLGRMVLEADRLRCADEVTVLAAALSIQDPRERPTDRRAVADQHHARFADPTSDFMSYLHLWRYLEEQRRTLSRSAFRRRCKAELLHSMRIREWQDLVGQVRRAARDVGVTFGAPAAEPDAVHQALLAGLLSHVGVQEDGGPRRGAGAGRGAGGHARRGQRAEFRGTRGARFALWPGSVLASKPPPWVVVAELVETSRLWGRTAAKIDPHWIEPLALHLVVRSYGEPRWERRRGSVVATETVTLHGLAIVPGRTVQYARVDPVLSRELFLRHALVEADWETSHAFVEENRRRLADVEAIEARARRRGLAAGDEALLRFFHGRVPPDVLSGATFDRWWREARRRDPDLLTLPYEVLVPDAAGALEGKPSTWRYGDRELRLTYRFEPGDERDGVTVHVPLQLLAGLRPEPFEWHLPGFREELVTTLLRALPKDLRRAIGPAPDVAAAVLERSSAEEEPLTPALSRTVQALRGVPVPPSAWPVRRLPPHLRVTFAVEDADGRTLAAGRDLTALRHELRSQLRSHLGAASGALERTGLRTWTMGTLPRSVVVPGTGGLVQGYPALVDEGTTVGVRVLETPQAQRAAMAAGTRRLLLLHAPPLYRWVRDRLDLPSQLALTAAPHGGVAAVLDDATTAAVDALIGAAGGPAWDVEGFERLRAVVLEGLPAATLGVVEQAARILEARGEVEARLEALPALEHLQPARDDVEAQLRRLLPAGFITRTGVGRLPDLLRYLRAAVRRLDRLPDAPAADRDRLRTIEELEAEHLRVLASWPSGTPLPPRLLEVPWLLEELRVSSFAQHLGTRQAVSAKRIRRALDP